MKCYLAVMIVLIPFIGIAQYQKDPLNYKTSISWSPLAMIQGSGKLIEGDNTFLVGMEYRITEKVAVVGEAGYIFSSNYTMNDKRASGFIVRPALRMYLNRRNNFYFQTQFFYKSVDYTYHDSLPRNINGNIFKAPLDDYIFRKGVWGMNFMIGTVLPVGDNIFLDPYIGFGPRAKYQRWINLENSDYNPINEAWISHAERVSTISIPFGVKLVYRIK
jgi:hypothetical protein